MSSIAMRLLPDCRLRALGYRLRSLQGIAGAARAVEATGGTVLSQGGTSSPVGLLALNLILEIGAM